MKNNIIALLTVSVLASCGGSGTGGADTVTVDADFAVLRDSALSTFQSYTDIRSAEDLTPFVAVPDVGTANYDGYAAIGQNKNGTFYQAVSPFTTTVNFAALNVLITADDFADTAGSIPGSFTFDTRIEDDGGPTRLLGTWAGDLTWSDGSVLSVDDAPIGGDFVGADMNALNLNSDFNGNIVRVVGLRQP